MDSAHKYSCSSVHCEIGIVAILVQLFPITEVRSCLGTIGDGRAASARVRTVDNTLWLTVSSQGYRRMPGVEPIAVEKCGQNFAERRDSLGFDPSFRG